MGIVTDMPKHTQLTIAIMGGATTLKVGYKIMLRAQRVETYFVCTSTCDIVGYISRK